MAYTPGLKRKELCLVRKSRRLSIKGEVLVSKGQEVKPETAVARTLIPGDPHLIDISSLLNIDPKDIYKYMKKNEGDHVKKDESIAGFSMFLGLFKKNVSSPIDGSIELISETSGQLILRETSKPIEVNAYIPGTVQNILPSFGAVIETPATFIQGIFGIGGETQGELKIITESDDILSAKKIGPECSGKILVTKTSVNLDVLRKAIEVGAKGLVCGGIDEKDLTEIMGGEIGVAITGDENIGLTLVVTEGFGENMKMPEQTFQLMQMQEGKQTSINGATQIRAGVLRPEIVIPKKDIDETELMGIDVEDTEAYSEGLKPGTPIRVIAQPFFGCLGKVESMPVKLQKIETESMVRVLKAELEDGRHVIVPRTNVEIIGE